MSGVLAWLDGLSVDDEAFLTTCWTCVVLLLAAGPAGQSPDGLELLALARSWLGGPPTLDPAYWPPLWAALVAPLTLADDALGLARLLNVVLLGAVAWPTWHLARCTLGRPQARIAVLLLALVPAVREYAPVLDARALGTLLTAATAAGAARAVRGEQGWAWAALPAAIAPLARPEGVALPVLLAVVYGGWERRWLRAVLGLPALLAPSLAWKILGPPSLGWSALAEPWYTVWPLPELTTLYGPASMPSAYRLFVLDALGAGLDSYQRNPLLLLSEAPASALHVLRGLAAVLGATGLVGAALGTISLARRGRKGLLGVTLAAAPLVAVALVPASTGQATPAANVLFAVPLLLVALSALPLRAAGALALVVLVETHLGPLRVPAPHFDEGSQASRTVQAWLEEHPSNSGVVAGGLESRGLVQAAGLDHRPLPSAWEPWDLPAGSGVVLTSLSLAGADGGRALSLLEDPAWEVVLVVRDDAHQAWNGKQAPQAFPYWVAYLEPR